MSVYIEDYKGWGSSSQKWPMMLRKNNGVVKLVLSFLQIKQRCLMANYWKKIDRIHTCATFCKVYYLLIGYKRKAKKICDQV